MRAAFGRLALCQLVLAVVGGCSVIAPTPQAVTNLPAFGNADRALATFDPTELAKRLAGGPACIASGGGGAGIGDIAQREWVLTCPRIDDDRTIYFLLTDAIDAELRRIATVPRRGGSLGNAQEPASDVWALRGNAYVGFVHARLVNGNGDLSIFVSIDLVAP
jgi:hypothetical protein